MCQYWFSPPQKVLTFHALELSRAILGAGSIRYWCSAGRGGFGISPLECLRTSFYCIAYKNPEPSDPRQGWKVKTSPVPIKDPYFATLKSTNYLANALVALDAQLEGFDQVRDAATAALLLSCMGIGSNDSLLGPLPCMQTQGLRMYFVRAREGCCDCRGCLQTAKVTWRRDQ